MKPLAKVTFLGYAKSRWYRQSSISFKTSRTNHLSATRSCKNILRQAFVHGCQISMPHLDVRVPDSACYRPVARGPTDITAILPGLPGLPGCTSLWSPLVSSGLHILSTTNSAANHLVYLNVFLTCPSHFVLDLVLSTN